MTITFPLAQIILFFHSVSSLIESVGLGEESCSLLVNMAFFKAKNKAKENSLPGMLALKMVMGRVQTFNLCISLTLDLVLASKFCITD